jgi:hypothetical protein
LGRLLKGLRTRLKGLKTRLNDLRRPLNDLSRPLNDLRLLLNALRSAMLPWWSAPLAVEERTFVQMRAVEGLGDVS